MMHSLKFCNIKLAKISALSLRDNPLTLQEINGAVVWEKLKAKNVFRNKDLQNI